jgi:hypothetical protein
MVIYYPPGALQPPSPLSPQDAGCIVPPTSSQWEKREAPTVGQGETLSSPTVVLCLQCEPFLLANVGKALSQQMGTLVGAQGQVSF